MTKTFDFLEATKSNGINKHAGGSRGFQEREREDFPSWQEILRWRSKGIDWCISSSLTSGQETFRPTALLKQVYLSYGQEKRTSIHGYFLFSRNRFASWIKMKPKRRSLLSWSFTFFVVFPFSFILQDFSLILPSLIPVEEEENLPQAKWLIIKSRELFFCLLNQNLSHHATYDEPSHSSKTSP